MAILNMPERMMDIKTHNRIIIDDDLPKSLFFETYHIMESVSCMAENSVAIEKIRLFSELDDECWAFIQEVIPKTIATKGLWQDFEICLDKTQRGNESIAGAFRQLVKISEAITIEEYVIEEMMHSLARLGEKEAYHSYI